MSEMEIGRDRIFDEVLEAELARIGIASFESSFPPEESNWGFEIIEATSDLAYEVSDHASRYPATDPYDEFVDYANLPLDEEMAVEEFFGKDEEAVSASGRLATLRSIIGYESYFQIGVGAPDRAFTREMEP